MPLNHLREEKNEDMSMDSEHQIIKAQFNLMERVDSVQGLGMNDIHFNELGTEALLEAGDTSLPKEEDFANDSLNGEMVDEGPIYNTKQATERKRSIDKQFEATENS